MSKELLTLGAKQRAFAKCVGELLVFAYARGYEISLGEAMRSPEEAIRLAKAGLGIRNSLHCQRLAIDLNLFKNGKLLTKSEDHTELGEWWEAHGGTWGGRFHDGNHYSYAHGGRK